MTSTTSAVSFFHKASLGPKSGPKTSKPRLSVLKISETRGLKWKTGMQTTSSLNSTTFETDDHEDLKNKIFTEKQYMEFERKLNNPFEHTVGKNFGSGSFLPNSAIFRQHYSIKAYEIGATGKISLETLMNLFQETGINSVKGMGLEIDMMGSTPEMRKRNLVWVATKVQVVIDRYPLCGDAVQVDNWSTAVAGKNCMRRDAVIRDCKTRDVLVRVSSIWVTMNTKTRRVGRIPEEVREELGPYLIDVPPILEDDDKKLVKLDEATAGYICPDLKPRRSDLDFNQHVNNAKYIGWILESVPRLLLEHHELSRITMEYKRECHKDNVLKSLTTLSGRSVKGSFADPRDIECFHLLKLENGREIMKARSEWRAKHANDLVNVV